MRRAFLALWAVALAPLTACAGAPGGAGSAPGSVASPREDRVTLTAFDVIPAVAASQHTVYIATIDGIGALDRDFQRWLPPVSRAEGYPGGAVTAIAADPMEEGVWIALAGALVYYRPSLGQVLGSAIPGVIDAIVFDRRDPGAGAYLHGAMGWSLASRTGMVVPVDPARVPQPDARQAPSTLSDVYRSYPSLRAAGALLTRDDQLQSWPVIAGTSSPDRSEVWLGTRGGGLFRVDPLFLKGEQIPYGPLQTGTGALARDSGGIWMAGLGPGGDAGVIGTTIGSWRAGLAFASGDLQHWRWLDAPASARVLSGARANRLSVRAPHAWVATDRGLALLDTRDASRALLWTQTTGLPDDRALAVAATESGAWVGTARGLAFVSVAGTSPVARASDVHSPNAPATAVRALLLAGDTLWIGSDAGVLLLRGASPDSAARLAALGDARLSRPVVALASSDSLVAVATERDLIVVDPQRAAVLPRFDVVNTSPLRRVNAMAMDGSTIWLAGDGGVLIVTRANGASRFLPAPGAVPAEAFDVVLDPDHAWVATRAGVLRLARSTDGGVR